MTILNHEELQVHLKPRFGQKIALLIGNGFSINLIGSAFSFNNLITGLNSANFHANTMRDVFSDFDTSDFEKIVKALEDAHLINTRYGLVVSQLQADSTVLRSELVACITRTHPSSWTDTNFQINLEKVRKIRTELRLFSSLFTLNYDLLLYWLLIEGQYTARFSDGFSYGGHYPKLFFTGDHFNLNFLHGGLHIFETYIRDEYKIQKLRRRDDLSLTEQVRDFILRSEYPLTVVEGTSSSKKRRISSNTYLAKCYNNLRNLTGRMVVYGCSFGQDDHILEAIGQSRITDIYISYYNEDERIQIADKVRSSLPGRRIYYYQSSLLF